MEFLNLWLQGIVVAVVVATIIEMIVPSGNNKKYIKVVLGVYLLFNIMTPIINKFAGSNFELSSIMNIEKYAEKMETYNTNNSNISMEKSNSKTIKQIYISNLKNDIKAKLQGKGYTVSKIEVKADDSENYNIEELHIYLSDELEEKQEQVQNKIKVNEIEKVEIQVGVSKNEIIDSKENKKNSRISNVTREEIKEYLSSIYEINDEKINIY